MDMQKFRTSLYMILLQLCTLVKLSKTSHEKDADKESGDKIAFFMTPFTSPPKIKLPFGST